MYRYIYIYIHIHIYIYISIHVHIFFRVCLGLAGQVAQRAGPPPGGAAQRRGGGVGPGAVGGLGRVHAPLMRKKTGGGVVGFGVGGGGMMDTFFGSILQLSIVFLGVSV